MRKYISLREAAGLLPAKRRPCTLWRWCIRGLYVRQVNEIIRLRHVYVGRRLFTTAEWLEDFFDLYTAARRAARQQQVGGRPGRKWQRYMELAKADAILREVGM